MRGRAGFEVRALTQKKTPPSTSTSEKTSALFLFQTKSNYNKEKHKRNAPDKLCVPIDPRVDA
jgi:hypothetical protein